jgi:hypothetical protein
VADHIVPATLERLACHASRAEKLITGLIDGEDTYPPDDEPVWAPLPLPADQVDHAVHLLWDAFTRIAEIAATLHRAPGLNDHHHKLLGELVDVPNWDHVTAAARRLRAAVTHCPACHDRPEPGPVPDRTDRPPRSRIAEGPDTDGQPL